VKVVDREAYADETSHAARCRWSGVSGEDCFTGHAIALCATCDAPLLRGKHLAVVGGGKSALTAVRNLVSFTREIHVVHAIDGFQADATLLEEVQHARNVTVQPNTEAREFLGREKLEGRRVAAKSAAPGYDLAVGGVLLEIGLRPNSVPVSELVPLNEAGEIAVTPEQSTATPGRFAADEETDEREKHIIVAAGAGARAALVAERYLSATSLRLANSDAA